MLIGKRFSRRVEYVVLYLLFLAPACGGSYYYIMKMLSTGESSFLAVGQSIFFCAIGIPICTGLLLHYLFEAVELNDTGMQFCQAFRPDSKIGFHKRTNLVSWSAVQNLRLDEGDPIVEYGGSSGNEPEQVNLSSFESNEAACRYIAERLPPNKVDASVCLFLDLERRQAN